MVNVRSDLMNSTICFFALVLIAQLNEITENAHRIANFSMQEFIVFLLIVLAGVVVWQNKEAKKAAAKSNEEAMIAATRLADNSDRQHKELVAKADAERERVDKERIARTDMFIAIVRDNTLALAHTATATDQMKDATQNLGDLIRDRIPKKD